MLASLTPRPTDRKSSPDNIQASYSTYRITKKAHALLTHSTMEQESQLQKVPNFRDVGKTVNQFLGERRIREGLFYRSGRLDDATTADKDLIRDELEIKTIVDLRTKTEILKQIRKHRRSGEASEIQGVHYHGIKINGKSFERHLLSLLSWWDFFKVIFFFILGYRIDAVRVLSRQVMLPRGLVRLGLDTLDYCGSEIHQALSLYTSPQTLPSIIHCTQGKDRTGLICALVLMILDIPRAAIEHDYFLTDAALMSSRPQMIVEIHEIGLTDDWAGTAKDMISSIESHIKDKYGSLDSYLDSIGFDQRQRASVQETLLF
ncbi:protein-tyrosine phosphatase-like protein [Trichoderma barbatum]